MRRRRGFEARRTRKENEEEEEEEGARGVRPPSVRLGQRGEGGRERERRKGSPPARVPRRAAPSISSVC